MDKGRLAKLFSKLQRQAKPIQPYQLLNLNLEDASCRIIKAPQAGNESTLLCINIETIALYMTMNI